MIYACQETDLVKDEIDLYTRDGKSEFDDIRNVTRSHIQELIDLERKLVKPLICSKSWDIDPVVYVSQDKRRCYTRYLVRDIEWRDAKLDFSNVIVGAYISNKWHFIFGSVTYYPRADYKWDSNTPFTFEELSYLANKTLFPRIVTKEDGEYIVSSQYFKNAFKELDSWNPDGDSLFLEIANGYPTESVPVDVLDTIRKKQKASQPRDIQPPSFYQRWFGKKKLFDSKEWKNWKSTL